MHSTSRTTSALRDTFLEDHVELEEHVARLIDAFEANDREGIAQAWSLFVDRLTRHLEAEERFMLPELFASHPRDARAILEEHRHIRSRLMELGCAIDLHMARSEAARGFIDELRAHARHEENVLYRWADEHLTAAQQKALIAQVTRSGSKEEPRPRASRSGARQSGRAGPPSARGTARKPIPRLR